MTYFYGMRRLTRPDDWRGIAGEENWVPAHSAYELAYAWQGAGGIPAPIAQRLTESGHPVLAELTLDVGLVEKPVFLDTLAAPSMTDLMGYARNQVGDRVVIAVEGKAVESFGLPVHAWVRGDRSRPEPGAVPRPTRERRLAFLAERLGLSPDVDSPLRYQLFHRTVSALSEAQLHGAAAAVLLVHSFARAEDGENWSAYGAFLAALGASAAEKGVVSGPLATPTRPLVPLFALWYDGIPVSVA